MCHVAIHKENWHSITCYVRFAVGVGPLLGLVVGLKLSLRKCVTVLKGGVTFCDLMFCDLIILFYSLIKL